MGAFQPIAGDNTIQEVEYLRIMVTALTHQLGGSAVVTEAEVHRIMSAGMTLHITRDELNNNILKEVDGR